MPIYVGNTQLSKIYHRGIEHSTNVGRSSVFTPGGLRDGLSAASAAYSAQDLFDNGISTNGNYWIVPQNGAVSAFQVYCEFDAYGNWMNITPTWGGYSNAIYYTAGGSGSSSMLAGANTNDPTNDVNCNAVTQNTAGYYGCSGQTYRGHIDLSSTVMSDFSLTSVKVRYRVTGSSCNCGYNFVGFNGGTRVVISGTEGLYAHCSGSPTYTSLNSSSYPAVGEAWNTFDQTTRELFSPYTACTGNLTTAMERIMIA